MYTEIKEKMGSNYYQGYSTSSDEEEEHVETQEFGDHHAEKEDAEVPDLLDKDEIA